MEGAHGRPFRKRTDGSFKGRAVVISETRLPKLNPSVLRWIEAQPSRAMYATEVDLAAISYGARKLHGTPLGDHLADWLETRIRPWIGSRALGVNEEALARWLSIGRDVQKKRGPMPPADLLIAAIAIGARMAVATRDIEPFVAAGVSTFNPWTGERFNGA